MQLAFLGLMALPLMVSLKLGTTALTLNHHVIYSQLRRHQITSLTSENLRRRNFRRRRRSGVASRGRRRSRRLPLA